MRQLPHPARDLRWHNSVAEISLLRPSYPGEKRIRIWVESCCRCFAWRRHGSDPATTPQRVVHFWDRPRIETRSVAGDRTRVAAPGTHRMRTWKVRNLKSHAGRPRRLAPSYTNHTHQADRSCRAGSKASRGRD